MTCPHQSQPAGKDTGRRICRIGRFSRRPFIGQCTSCISNGLNSGKPLPGTELKAILAQVGLKGLPGCQCDSRADLMDQRGPEWCERNLDLIVGWLAEEATIRGLPFNSSAGRLLVRVAIARSRRFRPAAALLHQACSVPADLPPIAPAQGKIP